MSEQRAANKIQYNKHVKRKNNDLVASMYAMYWNGESLADIGVVYRKSRQAVYDVFRSRGYKLRSKQLKGIQFFKGCQFTEMRGGYLRGTYKGERKLMHHCVWEYVHGAISKDCVIYHKDGNPANNNIDNLRLVYKTMMSKVFNPKGNNQYNKTL